MVNAIALIVCSTVFIIMDTPFFKNKNKKNRRDLTVWITFWIISITSVGIALFKISVPSPLLLMKHFYEPINNFIFSLFQ